MGISSYIHVHYPIYKYETVYKTDTIIYRDTIAIYEPVGMKNSESNELFNRLTELANNRINTKLQSDSTILELEPVPFTADDWKKIKKSYYTWRQPKLKKWPFNTLPRIPKKIKHNEGYIDTLMADLNFDGKLDVIFKIYSTEDWDWQYTQMSQKPDEYLSFISKGNEYVVVEHNGAINKAVTNLADFINSYFFDYYVVGSIDAVSVEDGIVIISGESRQYHEPFHAPTPGPNYQFECKFNYYMDKSGKGYADIKGIYSDNLTGRKQAFKIKYAED
jgi:hypothetical protein